MNDFLKEIKTTIAEKLKPEDLTLIDNTNLHSTHKSFDPKKFHLKLIIESKILKQKSKIDAHREIFSILKKEMKEKIHALEIEIK
tara:strand:- start:468 stop:722 length:255 start_codon:yes stop_codon:yes gene_type:complete